MKMISHLLFGLICATCVIVPQAHAASGGGFDHDNGGDICENRFKLVRDDLYAWIVKGGSKDLRLPAKISHEKYSHDMLEKFQTAKVSCVEEKVLVGSAEKTCKNFKDTDGSFRIQCNTNRFMTTSNSDQYILVHHEYSGLAGFEVNTGEDSNYEISNQITRGLVDIRISAVKTTLQFIVRVAKMSEPTPKDHSKKNNSICMNIGRINEGDITQELYRQLVSLGSAKSSGDLFPGSSKTFSKLRLNIMGLMNYCTEDLVKEDPNPISFEDAPGLLVRIGEIQDQLSVIEYYLNQRFPYNGDFVK